MTTSTMTPPARNSNGVSSSRYLPDVSGSFAFLSDSPGEMLEAGLAPTVRITTAGAKGPIVATYHVLCRWHPKDGSLEAVYLTKDRDDGECEVHTVEVHGRELGKISCTCRDREIRGPKRRVPHCRHSRFVFGMMKRFW